MTRRSEPLDDLLEALEQVGEAIDEGLQRLRNRKDDDA